MGILSSIPVISDLIDGVKDIVSEAVVDKDKRDAINLELEKLADKADERIHQEMIAQTEVNKVEAQHRSIFVAGWRPAIGWGCGLALVYNTLVAPMFGLGQADLAFLQTILMGMLGIAGLRSFDKVKGTSDDVLPIRKGDSERGSRNGSSSLPKNILPPIYSAELVDATSSLPEDAPWMK